MKTPVNGKSIRQHLAYNWWKYLLVAVIGIFGVDLLYTVTAPRVPEDKKVEFYVYGYADTDRLTAYMEKVRAEEFPDMVQMTPTVLLVDDTYGPVQLLTYVAVREGDLYLLPRENFLNLASEGTFLPLESEAELMDALSGADLQRGWRRNTETGENHLYGIPQDKLPGLSEYAYTNDGFLCILSGNGNEEATVRFLASLCRNMSGEETPAAYEPSGEASP